MVKVLLILLLMTIPQKYKKKEMPRESRSKEGVLI